MSAGTILIVVASVLLAVSLVMLVAALVGAYRGRAADNRPAMNPLDIPIDVQRFTR